MAVSFIGEVIVTFVIAVIQFFTLAPNCLGAAEKKKIHNNVLFHIGRVSVSELGV
jgi:hypothetical protein